MLAFPDEHPWHFLLEGRSIGVSGANFIRADTEAGMPPDTPAEPHQGEQDGEPRHARQGRFLEGTLQV